MKDLQIIFIYTYVLCINRRWKGKTVFEMHEDIYVHAIFLAIYDNYNINIYNYV